jgi:hypothetical protein
MPREKQPYKQTHEMLTPQGHTLRIINVGTAQPLTINAAAADEILNSVVPKWGDKINICFDNRTKLEAWRDGIIGVHPDSHLNQSHLLSPAVGECASDKRKIRIFTRKCDENLPVDTALAHEFAHLKHTKEWRKAHMSFKMRCGIVLTHGLWATRIGVTSAATCSEIGAAMSLYAHDQSAWSTYSFITMPLLLVSVILAHASHNLHQNIYREDPRELEARYAEEKFKGLRLIQKRD